MGQMDAGRMAHSVDPDLEVWSKLFVQFCLSEYMYLGDHYKHRIKWY